LAGSVDRQPLPATVVTWQPAESELTVNVTALLVVTPVALVANREQPGGGLGVWKS